MNVPPREKKYGFAPIFAKIGSGFHVAACLGERGCRIKMCIRDSLHLPEEMAFLFDAQLREAEVILLNKIDLLSQSEKEVYLDFLEMCIRDRLNS